MFETTNCQRWALAGLQLALGVLFFYAGFSKIFDSTWSAAGYLESAKTFSGFYRALARPEILPVVDALNIWGLTLVGFGLLSGILVRAASLVGASMMLLYYFPVLQFPFVGGHNLIIDQHIVFASALLVLFFSYPILIWRAQSLLYFITRRRK